MAPALGRSPASIIIEAGISDDRLCVPQGHCDSENIKLNTKKGKEHKRKRGKAWKVIGDGGG